MDPDQTAPWGREQSDQGSYCCFHEKLKSVVHLKAVAVYAASGAQWLSGRVLD